MMRAIISLFLFSTLFNLAKAQKEFFHSPLKDSFLKYEFTDTLKTKYYLGELYKEALKSKSKEYLTEYYLIKGWYAQDHSDFHNSLKYFQKSASLARANGYLQRESDAYGNIANLYDDLSETDKSMEFNQRALHICERILKTEKKDSAIIKRALTGKSAALGNLSYMYSQMKNYSKALHYIKAGMVIDSSLKNYGFLATSFSAIANIYKQKGEIDSAFIMFRNSIRIKKLSLQGSDFSNLDGLYQTYHSIGNLHKDLGNYDSAKHYYELSHQEAERSGDKLHLTFLHMAYGQMAVGKNELDEAVRIFKEGLDLSIAIDADEQAHYISKNLSAVYEQKGDFKNAIRYLKISNSFKDSLLNFDKIRAIGKAEVQYQLKFKSSVDSLNYQKNILAKEKIRQQENMHHEAEAEKRNLMLFGVVFILSVVMGFSFYLIKLYRGKKKAHEIISEQKKMTDHHLEIIADKQKEIVDSINYAKRIQYALLAHEEVMKKHLPEHFVLFKPKDIVSGDFYWFTHVNDGKNEYSYLAVCDSTGHGVPGAFMSLLNISFINEAIIEKNILQPNLVFNHARKRLVQNLGSDGQQDGFDGILIRIDHKESKIIYAAANNAPVIVNENETFVLPCDKMPVGKGEMSESFTLFEIPHDKSGILYLPTDGYSDQFGGAKGKKLKHSNMLNYFSEIKNESMSKQSHILNCKFEEWKGELEQLDDVCIIGMKIHNHDFK